MKYILKYEEVKILALVPNQTPLNVIEVLDNMGENIKKKLPSLPSNAQNTFSGTVNIPKPPPLPGVGTLPPIPSTSNVPPVPNTGSSIPLPPTASKVIPPPPI